MNLSDLVDTMAISHDWYEERDNTSDAADTLEPQDELTLDSYEIEEVNFGKVLHGLAKVDVILSQNNQTYELTVTEHPDRNAKMRASEQDGTAVYLGRTAVVPMTDETIEETLEGKTLDRIY